MQNVLLHLCAAALCVLSFPSGAQVYPSKNVTIVVPAAPGRRR